jgi:L-ascorbate metabolism protein UlaG (beta-lactamase superfamily)
MLICVATLLLSAQETEPPPSGAPPPPPETRLEITSLANAGFLLHAGEYSVLIDAFVKEPYKEYEALPTDVFKKMANGEAPFDGYVLALVSHNHPDHFQPLAAKRFLTSNPTSAMLASPQVVETMRPGDKGDKEAFRKIRNQVREVPVKKGEAKILKHQGMTVEMMLLAHGGEQNRGIVQNYGHLITIGGFNVLHIGDADMDPAIFEPYRFAEREIDLALIPCWFFANETGVRIVDELIRPKAVVACHVPAAEKELFIERMELENPHVKVFAKPMETIVLDRTAETTPTPPPEPEPEKPAPGTTDGPTGG